VSGDSLTFNDAVALGTGVTLTGTTSVTFNNTVAGGTNDLTVNSPTTTFGNAAGDTVSGIGSLVTDAAGTTTINTSTVSGDSLTFNDAVTLGTDTTLTGTSSVTFNGTVAGGSNNLTVTSPTTTFGNSTGDTVTGIGALVTNTAGTTTINTSTVSGDSLTFNDAVELGADTVLNASSVTFNSTLDSDGTARDLDITTTTGTVAFNGDVGTNSKLDDLTVNAGSGHLVFAHDVKLLGDMDLTIPSGSVDQTGGEIWAVGLTVSTGQNIYLDEPGNRFTSIDGIARGGDVLIYDAEGDLTIAGPISDSTSDSGDVDIRTTGLLSVNADITAAGLSDVTLVGGDGVNIASGVIVDAGSGVLRVEGQTGNITTANNSKLFTTGTVILIANDMDLDEGDGSRIGGDPAETMLAGTAILRPYSAYRDIAIEETGSFSLELSEAELDQIHATNVRIGHDLTRKIDVGTWTPGTEFAPGVLTLMSSTQGISQTGPIDLRTSTSDLILRSNYLITLDDTGNYFGRVAAEETNTFGSGHRSVTIVDADGFTVDRLTDDIGTVDGITATGTRSGSLAPGSITLTAETGDLILFHKVDATTPSLGLVDGNVILTTRAGAVLQTGGAITASGLVLEARDTSELESTLAAGNTFDTFAAVITGAGEGFSLNESSNNGFAVGTVRDNLDNPLLSGIETNNGHVRLTAIHGSLSLNDSVILGTGPANTRGDLALVAPEVRVDQNFGTIYGDQLYVEATDYYYTGPFPYYSFSNLDIRIIPGVPEALETGLGDMAAAIQTFLLTDPDLQTNVPGIMRTDTTDPENIRRFIPTVGDLMAVDVDVFDLGRLISDIQRKLSDVDDSDQETNPQIYSGYIFGDDEDEPFEDIFAGNEDGRVDFAEAFGVLFTKPIVDYLNDYLTNNVTETSVENDLQADFRTFVSDDLSSNDFMITSSYGFALDVTGVENTSTEEDFRFDVDFDLRFVSFMPIELGAEAYEKEINPLNSPRVRVERELSFTGLTFGVNKQFFSEPTAVAVTPEDFFFSGPQDLDITVDIADQTKQVFLYIDEDTELPVYDGWDVNVGFLGTKGPLQIELHMPFDAAAFDPSSPAALGFGSAETDVHITEESGSVVADRPLTVQEVVFDDDVTFTLRIGQSESVPVTVTAASTSDNTQLAELIEDVQDALDAAGLDFITASLTADNRIQLFLPATDITLLGFSDSEPESGDGVLTADSAISVFPSSIDFLLSVGGELPHLVSVTSSATTLDEFLVDLNAVLNNFGVEATNDGSSKIVLSAPNFLELSRTLTLDASHRITRSEILDKNPNPDLQELFEAQPLDDPNEFFLDIDLPLTVKDLEYYVINYLGFGAPGGDVTVTSDTGTIVADDPLSPDGVVLAGNLRFTLQIGASSEAIVTILEENTQDNDLFPTDAPKLNAMVADVRYALNNAYLGTVDPRLEELITVSLTDNRLTLALVETDITPLGFEYGQSVAPSETLTALSTPDSLLGTTDPTTVRFLIGGNHPFITTYPRLVTLTTSIRTETQPDGSEVDTPYTLEHLIEDLNAVFDDLVISVGAGHDGDGKITLTSPLGIDLSQTLTLRIDGSENPQFVDKPFFPAAGSPRLSYNIGGFTAFSALPVVNINEGTEELLRLDLTLQDFDQLLDFNVIGPSEVVNLLGSFGTWLEQILQDPILNNVDVPLAQATLGDFLNFGDVIQDELIFDDGTDTGKLVVRDAESGISGTAFFGLRYSSTTKRDFDTAQALAFKLGSPFFRDNLGVLRNIDAVNYDPATKELTYDISLEHVLADVPVEVDFRYDLAPLEDFFSKSIVSLEATGKFNATIGFKLGQLGISELSSTTPLTVLREDESPASENVLAINLDDGLAITGASDISSVVGRLTHDAAFSVAVLVSSGTAPPPAIVNVFAVDPDEDGLFTGTSENLSLADLVADINNSLLNARDASAAQPSVTGSDVVPVIDVLDADYRLLVPTSFDVTINDSTTIHTVTLTPADTAENNTLADLVVTLNRAIRAVPELTGRIYAKASGDGIRLASSHASVLSFTVDGGVVNPLGFDGVLDSLAAGDPVVDLTPYLLAVEDGDRARIVAADPAVSGFDISVAPDDPAFTELGLVSGRAKTVEVIANLSVDPTLSVDAVFTVKINDDSDDSHEVTVAAETNATTYELVVDINRALSDAGLGDRISAGHASGRIILEAVDQDIEVFSLSGAGASLLGFVSEDPHAGENLVAGVQLVGAEEVYSPYGLLTEDATFRIELNDDDIEHEVTILSSATGVQKEDGGTEETTIEGLEEQPIEVSVEDVVGAENSSIEDLVADINTALNGTDLSGKIIAESRGLNIVLRAIDESVKGFEVTEVSEITVDLPGGGSMQLSELGLEVGQRAEAVLSVSPRTSAPTYIGPGSDASFDVAVTGGTRAGTATVTLADEVCVDNKSIYDLISDVNRALDEAFGGAAGNPLVADFDGGRLVIRAVDSHLVTGITPTVYALTAPAVFTLSYDTAAGTTSKEVTITDVTTANNTTLDDLVNDINTALSRDVGPGMFRAEVEGTGTSIRIRSVNEGIEGFGITPDNQSTAISELGLSEETSTSDGVTGFTLTANVTNPAVTELKLHPLGPVPASGSVSLVADSADMVVWTRDGTPHAVTLDDLLDSGTYPNPELGDLFSLIEGQVSGLNVDVNDFGEALVLEDQGTHVPGNPFMIHGINGSSVSFQLGIDKVSQGSTIRGDVLGRANLSERFFIRQRPGVDVLSADFQLVAPDGVLVESANYGFVGVQLELPAGETLYGAEASIGLVDPAGDLYLSTMFEALADDSVDSLLEHPSVTPGSGQDSFTMDLSLLEPDVIRNVLDLSTNSPEITITLDDFGDPFLTTEFAAPVFVDASTFTVSGDWTSTIEPGQLVVVDLDSSAEPLRSTVTQVQYDVSGTGSDVSTITIAEEILDDTLLGVIVSTPVLASLTVTESDIGDLAEFDDVRFDDVVEALLRGGDFLNSFAAEPYLHSEIPLLGSSINDLVPVADRFNAALEDIRFSTGRSLQVLGQKIRENFGLPADRQVFDVTNDGLAYENDTTFTLAGDQTATLPGGFLVEASLDSGIVEGVITSVDFDGTVTSVVLSLNNPTDPLDSTLSDAGTGKVAVINPAPLVELSLVNDNGNDILKVDLNIPVSLDRPLPVDLDLEFTPDPGVGNIRLKGEEAGLRGSGTFTTKLSLGIDLTDPSQVVLFDHPDDTGIAIDLSVVGELLNFNATLGPLLALVSGGDAALDLNLGFERSSAGSGSPVPFTTSADVAAAFGNFAPVLTGSSLGHVDTTLPVFFPTDSDFVADVSFVANLGIAGGQITSSASPSVPAEIENLDFTGFNKLDIIQGMVDALDEFLLSLQDIMDSGAFSSPLPLVGDSLADGMDFIDVVHAGSIDKFRSILENTADIDAAFVRELLFAILGPGDPARDITGLGLFLKPDGTPAGTGDSPEDFITITGAADSSQDFIQWSFKIGQVDAAIHCPIGFDLGFDAVGLNVDAGMAVEVDWVLDLALGISLTEGPYVDVGALEDLLVSVDASLAGDTFDGTLGYLQLVVMDGALDPNDEATTLSADFSFNLLDSRDPSSNRISLDNLGGLDATVSLDADADVNLTFKADFQGDQMPGFITAVLPNIVTDFLLDWDFDGSITPSYGIIDGLQRVEYDSIYLDLGSFLDEFILPVLEKIKVITEPTQPIIDIVTARIPVLSDIAGQKVTLIDIAGLTGYVNPTLLKAVADVISLINLLETGTGSLSLPIGSFTLFKEGELEFDLSDRSLDLSDIRFVAGNASDINSYSIGTDHYTGLYDGPETLQRNLELPGELTLKTFLEEGAIEALTGFSSESENRAKTQEIILSRTGGPPVGEEDPTWEELQQITQQSMLELTSPDSNFKFPFLQSPAEIFGVFLNKDMSLIEVDLGTFGMKFTYEQRFVIWGPIWGAVEGIAGVNIDLAFGYDTAGIRKFAQGGYSNPLDLEAGFYVRDLDESMVDSPEVSLFAGLFAGAEVTVGFISVGVDGGLVATIDFDLHDSDNDGRVRSTELIGNFLNEFLYGNPVLAPIAIFDVHGTLDALLRAFVRLGFKKFTVNITPPITLLEFEYKFDRPPILATEMGDGTLLLNIGPNADARMNGNTADIAEQIFVRQDDGNFKVWAPNLGVPESRAQEYSGNSILAYGGEGDDLIDLTGVTVETEIYGDSGDDRIMAGDGGSELYGGIGNDRLLGGAGVDSIFGEAGNDYVVGRGDNDFLFGDSGRSSLCGVRASADQEDGDDIILGGDGSDIIFGGGGFDQIGGDVSPNLREGGGSAYNDIIFGDGGRIPFVNGSPDYANMKSRGRGGSDIIRGHGGQDIIFGGDGADDIDGGAENDTIYGENGFDTIYGAGGADHLFGGMHDDIIFGFRDPKLPDGSDLPGFGDANTDAGDYIEGGKGNDFIRGQGGADIALGGRGTDIIFGDVGDDYLFGEASADIIFGGEGHDHVESTTGIGPTETVLGLVEPVQPGSSSGNDIVFGDDGLVAFIEFYDINDPQFTAFDYTGSLIRRTTEGHRLIGDGSTSLVDPYVGQDDGRARTWDLMVTEVNQDTDGDDFINGGDGDDIVFGGAGNDTIFGDFDPDPLVFNPDAPRPTGQDVLIGDGGVVELANRLFRRIATVPGATGIDTISGNDDSDYIFGGSDGDFLYGFLDPAVTGINPDTGLIDNDVILGDDGEMLFDTLGVLTQIRSDRSVADNGGSDTADAGSGDDIVIGGIAGDTLEGGSGNDIVLGDNAEILLDTLTGSGLVDEVRTTDTTDADPNLNWDNTGGIDYVYGSSEDDILFGGVFGDFIYGSDGNDAAFGDNGEIFTHDEDGLVETMDLLMRYAQSTDPALGGSDTITGDEGEDVLIGGSVDDHIYGGEQDDIILGDHGRLMANMEAAYRGAEYVDESSFTLQGDLTAVFTAGARLIAQLESTTVSGEVDLAVYDGGTNTTTVTLTGGVLDGTLSSVYLFEDPEALYDLDLIETIFPYQGGIDDIRGNEGQDVAMGGHEGDFIWGDAETDSGSDSRDVLLGDNGEIFLVPDDGIPSPGNDDEIVFRGGTVETIRTTDTDTTSGGEDEIHGNEADDIMAGGVLGDLLHGNEGDDIILGDNARLEWASDGDFSKVGADIALQNQALWEWFTDPTGPGSYVLTPDTDYHTLDLITTELPVAYPTPYPGGRDWIYGDGGSDILFGGTETDFIHGEDGDGIGTALTNNDVMFGDHGRLYPQHSSLVDFHSRNFFAIDTQDDDGGDGDLMWGEEGDDTMLGQQGDDRMWGGDDDDDMTGGHNVAGGYDELTAPVITATLNPPVNDLMDGGSGNDSMAGDNAVIWRRGDDISPRFRALTSDTIYDTTEFSITANVGAQNQSDPEDAIGRDITLLDHADDTLGGLYGADVMAGGADSDTMFGQLADDLMQGDGSILDVQEPNPAFVTHQIDVDDTGSNPDTDEILYFNVPEAATDGDDYMEGSGGSDLMYGGLGQDDMIGGSSALFGLDDPDTAVAETLRPDGSDIIFGGAGIDTDRNDVGDTTFGLASQNPISETEDPDHLIITVPIGHARDADYIMGDNANVYRLVEGGASGTDPDDPLDNFLTFNYDDYTYDPGTQNYGLRVVPRAMEQLDYTLGGADFAGGSYSNGAANADNGAADLIHGESGDDIIFAMTGSDVVFGEGQDDDIVGGYGNDWISGGTGRDGVLGDDGLVLTSRNSTIGEPLYGIEGLLRNDPRQKYADGNVLDEIIKTPGEIQYALINVTGELKKTIDLVPFSFDPNWMAMDDEFPDTEGSSPYADDIIFGGLGSDWLHGGSGDDAISGAEALEQAYVPVYGYNPVEGVIPVDVLDLGYNAFDLTDPINPGDTVPYANPGDVLAFNQEDLDGRHLNNRFRAGEFALYDEYYPRLKIELTDEGELYNPYLDDSNPEVFEFLLNFNTDEGIHWDEGLVPKPTGQQTAEYGEVFDDGRDAIFGDLGNDWLVGGTGRDDVYGGWGNDLLNLDDDHTTLGKDGVTSNANDVPDTHPQYEDRAYGGAGRDVLIGNTGGDRLIDWVGEYNSYLVPYAPFGMASVSRTMQPFLPEFLYALSAGDGGDPTRPADIGIAADSARNGEPYGELGLVKQKDFAWQDQTGAPSDPQAGNIPGGMRDVLRSAAFSGPHAEALHGFYVDTGVFEVVDNSLRVSAESLGGDAAAVWHVDEALPSYFEIRATLTMEKPTGGWKANSYVIFDYYSPTDFKFAGLNASIDKIQMGYRDETGWHVVVQDNMRIKPGNFYNILVAVNGTNVSVLVDNTEFFSYTFEPRVIDDWVYGINAGMIGFGSDNSRGVYDNIALQVLPPEITLEDTEEYPDTSPAIGFVQTRGNWQTTDDGTGNYYSEGTPDAGSDNAVSLIELADQVRGLRTTSVLTLEATLNTQSTGGFVFDYYGPDDFKFAGIDAVNDQLVIGHHTPRSGWVVDAAYAFAMDAGSDYYVNLSLKGTSVSMQLKDDPDALEISAMVGHVFNAVTVDGRFGLLSKDGMSSFDAVTVKTNDPQFEVEGEALTAATTSTEDLEAQSSLTYAELDPIIEEAMERWADSVGDQVLSTFDDVTFLIADLSGDTRSSSTSMQLVTAGLLI
jgi:Ca2+-binding RTX toxin-like protein